MGMGGPDVPTMASKLPQRHGFRNAGPWLFGLIHSEQQEEEQSVVVGAGETGENPLKRFGLLRSERSQTGECMEAIGGDQGGFHHFPRLRETVLF
jgi:hypothetical protein